MAAQGLTIASAFAVSTAKAILKQEEHDVPAKEVADHRPGATSYQHCASWRRGVEAVRESLMPLPASEVRRSFILERTLDL